MTSAIELVRDAPSPRTAPRIDAGDPRHGLATAGDNDLLTLRYSLQVLAEPIMQLANPNLTFAMKRLGGWSARVVR